MRSCARVLAALLGLAALTSATSLCAQDSSATKTTYLPVIGSAPETGLQFGVAVLRTTDRRDGGATRPTVLMSNAVRTAKGQTRAFVDADYWAAENRWRVQGIAIAQQFPLGFWGFGSKSPEEARRDFTPRTTDLTLTVWRGLSRRSWLVGQARRVQSRLIEADTYDCPIEMFARAEPMGAPDANLSCVQDPIESVAGTTVLLSGGFVLDTRDNVLGPTRGHYLEVLAGKSAGAFGSDWDYTRVRVDARAFRTLGAGHVLGVQAQLLAHGDGEIPINLQAVVGNNTTMRGYEMGRYVDRALLTAQLEYRTPLMGKLGAAAFAGATWLTYEVERMFESRALPSVGAGIRYRLDAAARSAIRVDYAFGASGQRGLYIAFNEAF